MAIITITDMVMDMEGNTRDPEGVAVLGPEVQATGLDPRQLLLVRHLLRLRPRAGRRGEKRGRGKGRRVRWRRSYGWRRNSEGSKWFVPTRMLPLRLSRRHRRKRPPTRGLRMLRTQAGMRVDPQYQTLPPPWLTELGRTGQALFKRLSG